MFNYTSDNLTVLCAHLASIAIYIRAQNTVYVYRTISAKNTNMSMSLSQSRCIL
jgi:hypothetical protein